MMSVLLHSVVPTKSIEKKGTPTENPGQESFFGRFKTEWKDEISEIETFEELKKLVGSKIDYYNEERFQGVYTER